MNVLHFQTCSKTTAGLGKIFAQNDYFFINYMLFYNLLDTIFWWRYLHCCCLKKFFVSTNECMNMICNSVDPGLPGTWTAAKWCTNIWRFLFLVNSQVAPHHKSVSAWRYLEKEEARTPWVPYLLNLPQIPSHDCHGFHFHSPTGREGSNILLFGNVLIGNHFHSSTGREGSDILLFGKLLIGKN
jgi:hypothetical protein